MRPVTFALGFALGALFTYVFSRPKPRSSDGPAISATLTLLEGGTMSFQLPLVGVTGAKFAARFKNADERNQLVFAPEAFLTDAALGSVTMEPQPDKSYLVTVLHAETPGECDIVVKGKPSEDSADVIQASGTITFVDGAATVLDLDLTAGVLIPE